MWNNIIAKITEINDAVNGFVWGWPMIIMILGTGLLISLRLKFMQITKFGESITSTIVPAIKGIGKKKSSTDKKENSISQFEAFSAAISGTVGTGNIIGVTSAILTGGPGAVVWMWISAFFGMLTNYAENVLGLYYRKKDENGNFSGGAFYYIAYGLKQKWLGYIAAFFCLFAAIGMSGVQTNKISGTFTSVLSLDSTLSKIIIGIIVAVITGIVVIGGIKRIGKVASMLVPFMSLIFIIMAVIIIAINITAVPQTLKLIFTSVFSAKAVAGGVGGFAFGKIIQKGLARGVFSNEAGLGSSVIAHSASEVKEPVKQGLWGVFEVFFDTFIICTLTALVILTTNVANGAYQAGTFFGTFNGATFNVANDSATALSAFSQNLGTVGSIIFCVFLPLFAFTTILAWSYYGEKATEFFFQWLPKKGQQTAVICFKVIYVLLIVFASVIEGELIWAIDDTFNGLMALPNLIAVVLLSGQIVKITKNYYERKNGKNVEPMLSAYPELNAKFIKELEKTSK
ncbi:MAG: sodium:alanine symporter family protein [Clostridia bacterium]|nr:sodium:alanine symporter family protein [Clostridia bacterium]